MRVRTSNTTPQSESAGGRAGAATGQPRLTPWVAVGGVAAVGLAVVLVQLAGDWVYTALGYDDPGAVTRFGTSLVRLTADLAAAVCSGSLVFAAFFTSPRKSGGLGPDGYAALRWAMAAAWTWFAAGFAMIFFEMADASGQPLGSVLAPDSFLGLLNALIEPKAWSVTAVIALVLALSCHVVLSWRPTLLLAGVSLVGVIAPAVVSHSASNAGHDFGTNVIVIHVVAAALWLGTLVAVAAHLRRGGGHTALVLNRYRKLALVCFAVLAVSGTIDALILISPAELLTTGYGGMVGLKVLALLSLGAVGIFARGRVTRTAPGDGSRVLRLLGAEITIMLVTMGVSMGMAHTPPSNFLARDVSNSEVVLGYNLPGPPSLLNFLLTWRFDLILGTAAVVLSALYLIGVRRLRARGDHWPAGRTAAWLCGWVTVLIATSSGLGLYSSAVFSLHMLVHMVLNMLTPVLLVLGGPVTLALRVFKPSGRDNPAGPREWIMAALHSPLTRVLAHPGVASVLFAGSFYALYFTSLFESAMSEHWAHELMNIHFLIVGYLYYWTVIGVDPAPRPLPHLARLGMVFAVMPFHAFFGVIVMSSQTVIAENFYRTLNLPWAQDLLADQHLAGGIAWAAGEGPLVLVLGALLTQWYRYDTRQAQRLDRAGDDDLAAYNAMLAKLAETRGSQSSSPGHDAG